MITADDISRSYARLMICRQDYREAQRAYFDEKYKLDRQVQAGMRSGVIGGKNPDERKAAAQIAYQVEYGALETLADAAEDAKCALDIAWMEVNRVRALLRRDEIIAKVGSDDDDEADHSHGG